MEGTDHPARRAALAATVVVVVTLAACASPTSSTVPTAGPAGTTATTPLAAARPAPGSILFSAEGNNLWAYETDPPFRSQKVNTANKSFGGAPTDPNGWDINGQMCAFTRDGKQYLVTGEDTRQPQPPPGWGVFELTGARVGELAVKRVARLVPTYQPTPDDPDNYGCGVLSDGRIVTTDIGNEATDAANGQLTIWFPPYDSDRVAYCKLDLRLATGQGIYVDQDDALYLNSPRPSQDPEATAGGVFRYPGPFPTSATAAGGCGKTDNLGSPLADAVTKARVLSSGDHGLISPSGITRGVDGHFFVASVITGSINEYDQDWQFVQTVLQPPAGEQLGATPFSTGTPIGISSGPDGTLYYADIGIVTGGTYGFGPGDGAGSVRRITFTSGAPDPPETIAANLWFPDGVGLWPRA
ncbi:MAG: hypothetical protein HYX32_10565 [Actinobacteria bacterium]|nr:hypothetical protein [Actinomycetota bacterium]